MKPKHHHALKEAAEKCGLPVDVMIRFISFQWIVPAQWSPDEELHFLDEEDMARAQLIWQLQEEFGVNDESVPIILQLIDQLNRTHLEIKSRGFVDV